MLSYVFCDEQGRMSSFDLEQAIEQDLTQGLKPVMVIATAGTTVRGSFDPFVEIAQVCEKYNIWFHVDGALEGLLFGIHVLMNK